MVMLIMLGSLTNAVSAYDKKTQYDARNPRTLARNNGYFIYSWYLSFTVLNMYSTSKYFKKQCYDSTDRCTSDNEKVPPECIMLRL